MTDGRCLSPSVWIALDESFLCTRSTADPEPGCSDSWHEMSAAGALEALKKAFKSWATRNPKEASSRNDGNCVTGLASFLDGTVALPGSH
jgi:hypothetical protein